MLLKKPSVGFDEYLTNTMLDELGLRIDSIKIKFEINNLFYNLSIYLSIIVY